MTKNELVQRAKRRLMAGSEARPLWAVSELDIAANVEPAAHRLAFRVMMDDDRRTLLQQAYTVNLDSAGVGDVLAATGSITGNAGEILQGGINVGAVIDFENNRLVNIANYSDFIAPAFAGFGYYNLNRQKIATRAIGVAVNSPADIQSVLGPLTIVASFCPSEVTDWPLELQDDLVNEVVAVTIEKLTEPEE